MILVDANIVIYAYNPDSEHHRRAKEWLEDRLSEAEPVRFASANIKVSGTEADGPLQSLGGLTGLSQIAFGNPSR